MPSGVTRVVPPSALPVCSLTAEKPLGGLRISVLGLAIALAFVGLLVPLLIVDVPPVLDYPNHYARMWLIAGGAQLAPLDQMYAVDWSQASTNIGIDLMAQIFGHLLGAGAVAKTCLIASILLPCLGCLWLHRRVFGGAHWWQLTFVLPAFGKTGLAGFMNFNIGVGLALVGAVIDENLVRRGRVATFCGRAVIATVTLIFHPFATLAYAGLVVAMIVGREMPDLRSPGVLADKVLGTLMAALAIGLPVGLLLTLSPHSPLDVERGRTLLGWAPFSAPGKLGDLLTAYRAYVPWFDGLVALITLAIAGLAICIRRCSVHVGLLLAGLAFAAVALVMPARIGDAYWVETRLPVFATFILLASIRPEFAFSGRRLAMVSGALLALGLARTAVVGTAWSRGQQDVQAVRHALSDVPSGASVLPITNSLDKHAIGSAPFGRYFAGRNPAFWSYPALAVIARHAFVPTLWTVPGQHSLRTNGDWRFMSGPFGGLPIAASELGNRANPPPKQYLTSWRRFDYILHLNADMPTGPDDKLPAQGLELVSDQGFAKLYRIVPQTPDSR